MKDSIQKIQEKLKNLPNAHFAIQDDWLEVTPSSDKGFPVSLYDYGDELIVSFGGWHQNFKDADEALDCFGFGLSSRCRLKVFCRGTFEYKWIVQSQDNGDWSDNDVVGLLLFPFWQKKTTKYLQNDLWDGL